MELTCSIHCGHFFGVKKESYEKNKGYLTGLFKYVHYDEQRKFLDFTGATDLVDDPSVLTEIFDRLSTLLNDTGKGRLMLQCDSTEVCFFRKNMWKLMTIDMPEDPFDNIRYV